jgi:hypothetical protein
MTMTGLSATLSLIEATSKAGNTPWRDAETAPTSRTNAADVDANN